MKLSLISVGLCLLLACVWLQNAAGDDEATTEKGAGRQKRHLFQYIRRRFLNFGCRMRHRKTVLDRNGRFVTCVRYCGSNYQEGVSSTYGHYCKPRERYLTGCANRRCTSCVKNWVYNPSGMASRRCVTRCPSGTYLDKPRRRCERCRIAFCTECSSRGNCTQCVSGRPLYPDVRTGNGRCVLTCPSGFASRYDRPSRAVRCVKKEEPEENNANKEGCADRFCIRCKDGYFRLRTHGSQLTCVTQCPSGFATSRKNCRACLDPRCGKCTNDTRALCYECKPGFALLARSPFLNECVRECPTTHFLLQNNGTTATCDLKPEPVCSIKNCDKCVHTDLTAFHVGCERCKSKYYLKRDSFSDRCLAACPPGYYEGVRPGTKIQSCLKCKNSFCASCSSEFNCLACMPPFVLQNGRCRLCSLPYLYSAADTGCVYGGDLFTPRPTTLPAPVFKIE